VILKTFCASIRAQMQVNESIMLALVYVKIDTLQMIASSKFGQCYMFYSSSYLSSSGKYDKKSKISIGEGKHKVSPSFLKMRNSSLWRNNYL